MKNPILIFILSFAFYHAPAQGFFSTREFTRQDTLRGSITPERVWWDLIKYELSVKVEPEKKYISGRNLMSYKVLEKHDKLQIDLQAPMQIDQISQDGEILEVVHEGNAHFVQLEKEQVPGEILDLLIEFSGKPRIAKNPPWDGGFTWAKDSSGIDFIATSNQGIGASLWWPCKDHAYDEPDKGMIIQVNVPEDLIAVSNGRLKSTSPDGGNTTNFTWEVLNPINNYGVNINIGDYVLFSEKYNGEKGILDMDYWVLRQNLEKAKFHFQEAPKVLEAFEYWFGPYPFYEDSYKLVEVPYLGMEHQSSVTYGNGFQKGYRGTDLSSTGWGLKWDYIIVHESGHEWFANNITYKDIADMWIHEGFTMYSESLYIEYYYGKEAASEYTKGIRMSISNTIPLIGKYGVNSEGSGDMYNKGNNLLHTLRQIVNDDTKWREMLRGLNEEFYHQTVSTDQVEKYMAEKLGLELTPFFDQYLRDSRIPVFEYRFLDGLLYYRWSNCIQGFKMPVKVYIDGSEKWLNPTTRRQSVNLESDPDSFVVDPEFYIYSFNTMGK